MNPTPRARTCACGGPAVAAEALQALQALQAFDQAVALVDVTHQIVRWCSERFNARTDLEPGDPVRELLARVPGARGAFDSLSARAPQPSLGAVRAARVGVGLVALSLGDSVDFGQGHADAKPRAAMGCESAVAAAPALVVSEMARTLAYEINQPLGAVVKVLQGIRLRLGALPFGTLPDTDVEALGGSVTLALEHARYAERLVAPYRCAHPAQPVLTIRPGCPHERLDMNPRHIDLVDDDPACRASVRAGPTTMIGAAAADPSEEARQAWMQRLSRLTPREREVHHWVIQDRLNKTISDLLGISIKTVELHRANLMRKLGARSLTHLVKMTVSGCVS